MRVNSIQLLIEETKKCLNNGCDLAALIVALTIPDVCGNVMYPNDKNGARYRKWFDHYIGDYEQFPSDKDRPEEEQTPYMSGDVVYKLRCALLHEGTNDIASKIHIDEFNLMLGNSFRHEKTKIEQRKEYMSDNSTISHPKVVTWDINVHQLCNKIIWASEVFLEKEAKDAIIIPTIQICSEMTEVFKVK